VLNTKTKAKNAGMTSAMRARNKIFTS
jgi:hypothetical protein